MSESDHDATSEDALDHGVPDGGDDHRRLLRWRVSGRLINPAIDGIAENWLAGCYTASVTTRTRVLSYFTTGVETSRSWELRLWSSPNPGHGETTIYYTLPAAGPVVLGLYDVAGRRVATPVRRIGAVGTHRVTWRPEHRAAGAGGSSVLLARLEFAGSVCVRRIIVVH